MAFHLWIINKVSRHWFAGKWYIWTSRQMWTCANQGAGLGQGDQEPQEFSKPELFGGGYAELGKSERERKEHLSLRTYYPCQLHSRLSKRDRTERILKLHHSFDHKNHLCIAYELLSYSLYDLLKQNKFRGLPMSMVRTFTVQLLETLVLLKEAMVIHCDLKPENILLKRWEGMRSLWVIIITNHK